MIKVIVRKLFPFLADKNKQTEQKVIKMEKECKEIKEAVKKAAKSSSGSSSVSSSNPSVKDAAPVIVEKLKEQQNENTSTNPVREVIKVVESAAKEEVSMKEVIEVVENTEDTNVYPVLRCMNILNKKKLGSSDVIVALDATRNNLSTTKRITGSVIKSLTEVVEKIKNEDFSNTHEGEVNEVLFMATRSSILLPLDGKDYNAIIKSKQAQVHDKNAEVFIVNGADVFNCDCFIFHKMENGRFGILKDAINVTSDDVRREYKIPFIYNDIDAIERQIRSWKGILETSIESASDIFNHLKKLEVDLMRLSKDDLGSELNEEKKESRAFCIRILRILLDASKEHTKHTSYTISEIIAYLQANLDFVKSVVMSAI